MIVSRPYKLYGTSELTVLKESFLKKINSWFSEWSDSNDGLQLLELSTETIEKPVSQGLYSVTYEVGDSSISISIEEELYINFPDVLLPMSSPIPGGHSTMVKDILSAVFFDLITPYIKIMGIKNINQKLLSNSHSVDFDISGNTGYLIIQAVFKQGSIFMKLPYTVIEKMNIYQSENIKQKPILVKRSNCSIPGDIKLTVNVGGAEIDFGSVVGMQKGDVIRLDSKITDKMEVTTGDGEFICNAYLGKLDTNKAIKVII